MINIEYQAPEGRLAQSVSTFYRLDYEGDGFSEIERADRAQFRFHLRGRGEYYFENGHVVDGFPVMIIGPTTGPCRSVAIGPQTIFGWGMLPTGWAELVGLKANKLIDNAIDAREIFGDSIMDLHHQLLTASDFAAQMQIGIPFACSIHTSDNTAPFEFTSKVDRWLLENNDPNVDELVLITGLSPRQLERNTKRYYGMPPKKLARKYRALRAAHALARGDSLDDSAIALAFYDQSHLIREVKQFTGLTPSQLRNGASELTQRTMQGRHELGDKVSGLISES